MTRKLLVLLVASSIATALVGCGQSTVGGAGDVNAKDAAIVQTDREIAQKAGGKWENLTAAQQKMFLDRAGGNLDNAKREVGGLGRPMPPNMNKTGS